MIAMVYEEPSRIPRLYDAEEGRVLIDGVDVREYDLGWLRRQVGMEAHVRAPGGVDRQRDAVGVCEIGVRRDVVENGRQRAHFQRIVRRYGEVMRRRPVRREADVAPGLARHAIPKLFEGSCQLGSAEIPRQSHAAITSSRT